MEFALAKENRFQGNRLRRVLWILVPFLTILPIWLMPFDLIPLVVGGGLFFLGVVDIVILYITAEKYYNWPLVFFILFFTGVFFKRQHWMFATTLGSIAVVGISFVSLANSIRLLINSRQNSFLRWFGSISGLIVTLYLFGWINMLQGWPRSIGDPVTYAGGVLFIISILGMAFTLPGSNYISWTAVERKTFFRAVLIPMIIVFFLIIITIVFEDGYRKILDSDTARWHRSGIELFDLEGIPRI
jgi:hypothetical protein